MNKENPIYYRPEWTCGRYNQIAHAAIYYNLITGVSYFFEEYSADVVGVFLSIPKNKRISLEVLSNATNISEKSLIPFANELCLLGLLAEKQIEKAEIADYRKACRRKYDENPLPIRAKVIDSHSEIDDAESLYEARVGGITNVMFELTYNCSEKCIHCYNIGASRNDQEENLRSKTGTLEISEYKRIIDELYDEGLTKVLLSGGDPFSYSDIWEIIDYLYSKDIAIDIFTNGMGILHKERLLAKYFPHRVCLSIYSGIDKDHDRITRVNGSLKKTMSALENLHELSIPMTIKCCIIKPNLKSYYTVTDIGKKYGIPVQYELNVSDSIEGDRCVSKYLRLSPEQLEIVLRDPNTVMYVGKDIEKYGETKIDMERNACKAGYHTFCVTPNGNLIPCCAFHLSFGNLQNQSVHEIISKSDLLKWWRNLKVNDYEECGKKKYCGFCNFCVGINYSEHGTPIKAAENNCYVAKIRYQLAQKIEKESYDPLKGMDLKSRLNQLQEISVGAIQREFSYKREQNVDK
ncbi:MAG: radical SAM protein [Prevotella sp.]|nr:radical SAM protein [Prevotella sp.]